MGPSSSSAAGAPSAPPSTCTGPTRGLARPPQSPAGPLHTPPARLDQPCATHPVTSPLSPTSPPPPPTSTNLDPQSAPEMLKFFGGVSSAPDQTTPKASDQRNPFEFFSPSSRKGSVANAHPAAGSSGPSSGTVTATPSGSATPAQRQSVSTPGLGSPSSATAPAGSAQAAGAGGAGGVALDPPPPTTPGSTGAPQTPGGAVRSQPTTGAQPCPGPLPGKPAFTA